MLWTPGRIEKVVVWGCDSIPRHVAVEVPLSNVLR
jgi:hypothetical protein